MTKSYFLVKYYISKDNALLKRNTVLVKALNEGVARNMVQTNLSSFEDKELLETEGLDIKVEVQQTLGI